MQKAAKSAKHPIFLADENSIQKNINTQAINADSGMNMMNFVFALIPEGAANSTQAPVQAPSKRRFNKKLYLAIAAVVAVAVIAVALFIPQGAATIPLTADFKVGEKLTYNTTTIGRMEIQNSSFNASSLSGSNLTLTGTETVEVMSFDGEFYTLNHTTTENIGTHPITISILEKMNKTGYSTYMINYGNATMETSDVNLGYNGYLIQLLSKPEVKVGDSITIPFPFATSTANIGVTGDLTMTFVGIQDVTVPAGTFRTFRVDITTNNLQMTINTPSFGNMSGSTTTSKVNLEFQMYMEYGTMRQIKSAIQENMTFESTRMNYTMSITMNSTLQQDLKP